MAYHPADDVISSNDTYKVHLPEEISQSKGYDLVGHKVGNDIYLEFDGHAISTDIAPAPPIRQSSVRGDMLRSYQIELDENGDVAVYDMDRLVGVLPYKSTCLFHKIIIRDND